MGRTQYKTIFKKEYVKNKRGTKEQAEEVWSSTQKILKSILKRTKGEKGYSELTYRQLKGNLLSNEDITKLQFTNEKTTFKNITIERFTSFIATHQDFTPIWNEYIKGNITYEQLKEEVENYKNTNIEYLTEGSQ